jgi:ribosomal protein L37AE/L43A
MEPTFRISALGIRPDHTPQEVRSKLQPMVKDAAAFNDIFHRISTNQSVVLGENLSKDKAEKLLEKLTTIGLKCRIDPMALSLVPVEEEEKQNNVYRCPACGHCQPPARGDNLDICERCGVVGRNYESTQELKQALEMERQRLRSALEKEKKEKLEGIQAIVFGIAIAINFGI